MVDVAVLCDPVDRIVPSGSHDERSSLVHRYTASTFAALRASARHLQRDGLHAYNSTEKSPLFVPEYCEYWCVARDERGVLRAASKQQTWHWSRHSEIPRGHDSRSHFTLLFSRNMSDASGDDVSFTDHSLAFTSDDEISVEDVSDVPLPPLDVKPATVESIWGLKDVPLPLPDHFNHAPEPRDCGLKKPAKPSDKSSASRRCQVCHEPKERWPTSPSRRKSYPKHKCQHGPCTSYSHCGSYHCQCSRCAMWPIRQGCSLCFLFRSFSPLAVHKDEVDTLHGHALALWKQLREDWHTRATAAYNAQRAQVKQQREEEKAEKKRKKDAEAKQKKEEREAERKRREEELDKSRAEHSLVAPDLSQQMQAVMYVCAECSPSSC